MNLGQCENILKYNYNISNNNSLYMLFKANRKYKYYE